MEAHLVTLTDRGRSRGVHNKRCGQRVDDDRHLTLSGARTVGGVHRSGHMVSGGLVGLDVNRGSRAVASLSIPEVSHIAFPTLLINIQRGMLALADAGGGSAHKQVGTEGLNVEVVGSQLTTLSGEDRNVVGTGRNRNRGGGVTGAPHEDTRNIRLSSQHSAVVLTKDIDTSNRNLGRSRIDSNRNRSRSLGGDTTLNADSLSSEGVLASLIEVDGNHILVLTRNLDTILVPDVTGNLRINRSREGNLLTLANHVRRSSDLERSGQLVDDDRHLTLSGTRTVGRRNRSGHMISSRAVGLDINRGSRAVASLSIPEVSHIALPTILINIERGVLAAADAGSGSAHKQIGTEGLNREGLRGHLTTLNSSHRHSVNTSRNDDRLLMRTSAPSPLTLNIRVSSQSSAVVLTEDINTADRNSARSRVDTNLSSHGRHLRGTTGMRQRDNN